jgi:hypothetical protein
LAITNNIHPVIPYVVITTATRYVNYYAPYGSSGYGTDAEARCKLPKCRIKRFTVSVSINTRTSAIFTIMKNGVASAVGLTYGSSEIGVKTVTCDLAMETTDEYSIRCVSTGSGSTSMSITWGVLEIGNY